MDSPTEHDVAWVQARRKAAVIARTLPDAPPMVRLSVAEAARVLGVARATVFRWRIRFDADRRVTSLLPRCRGRRRGTSQINSKIGDLIDAQIRSLYLQPERPSVRSLVERVHLNCDELGLARTSWRLPSLPALEVATSCRPTKGPDRYPRSGAYNQPR